MKFRSFMIRCAALLLILVFSQKTGAGLFLHNLLHASAAATSSPDKSEGQNREISYTCSCIDDFLMPFIEAEPPVEPLVVSAPGITPVFFHDCIAFSSPGHASLRGPPAFLL